MKKEKIILILYTIFLISGSLWAIGEKTLTLGADSGWENVNRRENITEAGAVRPYPVLLLSSARPVRGTDISLSFDEGDTGLFNDSAGNYDVQVSPLLFAADRQMAIAGNGAAMFSRTLSMPQSVRVDVAGDRFSIVEDAARQDQGITPGFGGRGPLNLIPRKAALLSPGNLVGDFSLEFWLFPANMENGEQILAWTASKIRDDGRMIVQRIQLTASRNRLQWTFDDFFAPLDGRQGLSITLNGVSPLVPRTWSHHLICFDSSTGLLEYLINGKIEDIVYATETAAEGSEVQIPLIGEDSILVLGGRFTGILDEFRIYNRFLENPVLDKYPVQRGRIETKPLNLGEDNSRVLRVDVSGGRLSYGGNTVKNYYGGTGPFRFEDDSELRFFIRASDSPFAWTDADWRPVNAGVNLNEAVRGRYVQMAVEFFPSGAGDATPYLEELRITYMPDMPPLPPTQLTAIARDGAVELNWKKSVDADVTGYLVYFGTARSEYFGVSSRHGASPINVGKRTSFFIDGLENGTLYYFAVAAYDRRNAQIGALITGDTPSGVSSDALHAGEFSREVSARPLRTVE
ncbi:MAG: hypothetical protein LBQ88_21615 [Treponema sp.]|jgi:hypothetical protein|nr:hypothetical protein [Treponema sp.]